MTSHLHTATIDDNGLAMSKAETDGRAVKVSTLAHHLGQSLGVCDRTLVTVRNAGDAEWARWERAAGVQPCSPRSRELVARAIADAITAREADPFAGIC